MAAPVDPADITLLLRRWNRGDPGAYDQLVSAVYQRLLSIATGLSARDSHATSPAALVNEGLPAIAAIAAHGLEGPESLLLVRGHANAAHFDRTGAQPDGGKTRRQAWTRGTLS